MTTAPLVPLADVHCHLLPGLDDGPRDWDEALAMCRAAWEDGTQAVAATAHQSKRYQVTPEQIREATTELRSRLQSEAIPLTVFPTAEIMIEPDTEAAYRDGRLLSLADRGRYLLIELPTGIFLDLREMISNFWALGVRPILAHPERQQEFLDDANILNELIHRGCLIQVSADSITQNRYSELTKGLQDWARRGVIHLIGSDGHSLQHRPPGISAAYERLATWIGWAAADRICSTNGLAVLEGLPLTVPRPQRRTRRWLLST